MRSDAFWEYFCQMPSKQRSKLFWGASVASHILWLSLMVKLSTCSIICFLLPDSEPLTAMQWMGRKNISLCIFSLHPIFSNQYVGNTSIIENKISQWKSKASLCFPEESWPKIKCCKMFEAENEWRQSCRQQRQQCEVGDVSLGRYQFERKLHNSRFSQPTIRRNNTLNIDEPTEPKIDNSTAILV